MSKLLTTIILLCFSVGANAQLRFDFIKVTDFDFLDYVLGMSSSCPFAEQEAMDVIEGVIIRSRIRAEVGYSLDHFFNEPYLDIKTTCLETRVGGRLTGYTVAYEVRFGKGNMLWDYNYGNIYTDQPNNKQNFLNVLSIDTEAAITDFVKVNFLSDSN